MAVRGRRTAPQGGSRENAGRAPHHDALVRIHDLAGRPRGTGVVADHDGTVLTSHETVDGLTRLVLHDARGRSCVVTADAVTPLPELDLALVQTEGLGANPLPVTVRDHIESGTYVRIAAGGWREARVLGATSVTYTATDRFHLLDDVLELAIGTAGRDALRLGGGAAGGPVVDVTTGAVVAVLGTALQAGHRDTGFAVPLRRTESGPLADLLARNAATVPAYGADLNLAGVLELTGTSVGQDGAGGAVVGCLGGVGAGAVASQLGVDGGAFASDRGWAGAGAAFGAVQPVERAAAVREFDAFTAGPAIVLGLVGPPGSGRTTELAALADRRSRGAEPAPTLWLRGSDLRDDDASVADAARRALTRAARIVAASGAGLPTDLRHADPDGFAVDGGDADSGGSCGDPDAPDPAGLGDIRPERVAALARAAGRPLLLLLDGPEEMPPVLAHRLPEWTDGTARWLRETGARLVVACRAEYWERAGAEFPREFLHAGGQYDEGPGNLPPYVHLGDLDEAEAREARARYGLPEDALTGPDARHPLTLRLLSEVRAALPDAPVATPVDRHDVLSAHLDLMCLRVAVRLAAENGLRGTAVRRLAARVAGQVHEAARRSLGPGQGELDRESFEALFPWGPAPARLGGGTGWASAVLTEGLLVPAGTGYRFAHEELADWLQGTHLDLDEALRALVHRPLTPHTPHPLPVPHHRIGPVVQALLLVARQQGTRQLARRLEELVHALDADPRSWWAARLLAEVLRRVPDATPYVGVLRLLADGIADWRRQQRPVPGEFGPAFWTDLPLSEAERLDLLRRLVRADTTTGGARYLDAAAHLLAADPTAVQPHLARWFDDERPLPATPHATVATAAQALLHTHRHRALDDLTEVLVDSAHPRGDELLAVLAEEEPSAVCRAVDRWAHDERPARRVAAVAYGLRAAPHARTEADRQLLRYAALTLLARPADGTLHGGALGILVRDPLARARHLPRALEHFAAGDPQLPPSALAAALPTHPEAVLDAFRTRLHRPDAGAALLALADVTTPALARRVADLVREAVARRPDRAAAVAAYVDRRLDQGPLARTVLFPLVTGVLDGGPEPVRTALAAVLAGPGPLRRELRAFLLAHECTPAVLESLLRAAARHDADDLGDLVHHTGLLLVRTPDGATRFDRALVDLGREVPGFAARAAGWLADAPQDWAVVVGPSTRRMIENLAGVRVPA
ncbi:trypsin-like peptidase domain-containing protein [Streptomyces sp. NPDC127197]|uniref:trypsin-like peptidase domain-containing protein n=1 Tax=Streptomyces sp. NPDC127197 TaxID=3345388 RepID=UPI003633BF5C